MAFVTRRKTAAAALVVVGIAGLSIASAAQLNIKETASLGAGETVVAACQTDGAIEVSFANAFAEGAYQTTAVNLTNVDAACNGLNYLVTVDAGSATPEKRGKVVEGTTTITLDSPVAAADVDGVAVVIFD